MAKLSANTNFSDFEKFLLAHVSEEVAPSQKNQNQYILQAGNTIYKTHDPELNVKIDKDKLYSVHRMSSMHEFTNIPYTYTEFKDKRSQAQDQSRSRCFEFP